MLTETVDSRWSSLYKLGGAVAIAIAVLLVGEGVVYAVLPNRSTPVEFLALFRDSWLTGLLNFDLLGMICYLLFIPMILSLYVALRRTNRIYHDRWQRCFSWLGLQSSSRQILLFECSRSAANMKRQKQRRNGRCFWHLARR